MLLRPVGSTKESTYKFELSSASPPAYANILFFSASFSILLEAKTK